MEYVLHAIKEDTAFREVIIGSEQDYVVVEMWTGEGKFVIISYYNPC